MAKDTVVLNPFDGRLLLVPGGSGGDAAGKIVTHTRNPAGNPLVLLDPVTGQYYALGPLPVTDSQGNVVSQE